MKHKNNSVSHWMLFKSAFIALLLGVSFASWSQIITTFAGNYNEGGSYSGDGGPATAAGLFRPIGVAVDASGNVYIADANNYLIRTVNTSGTISTFAGIASGAIDGSNEGYSGDGGPATAAELYYPGGIAAGASGNVYIADYFNSLIRIVNTSGIISTFAGIASGAIDGTNEGYSGDGGPATAADLNIPEGIAVDASGNVYIADRNNDLIRKVNTSGIISTIAGDTANGAGIAGYTGDGGPATAAVLNYPIGIAVDASGNVYIVDQANSLIRIVNTSGIISTFAGNHNEGRGYSGDGGPATAAKLFFPAGITIDASGNVYIADQNNGLIRIVNTSGTINTFAGNYNEGGGYSGDGGPATVAEIQSPRGMAVDASGNVYIGDFGNNVVRKVSDIFYVSGNVTANVSCNGESNGSASISYYYKGTSPYTYSWSPSGGTNSTATGLSIGTYTITVTDDGDSTASAEVIITLPTALSATTSITANVSCNGGNNGNASATPSGGTSPYTYSWSNGNTSNLTGAALSAGSYTVTVQDNCGTLATASVTITQPNALSTTASVTANVSCNGGNNGNASASPSDGTSPYTYSWSNGNTSNPTGAVLSAGTYTVTVQDSCGASATASVTITQPNALSTVASVTANASCNGGNSGSASAMPSDGTSPYTYSWSSGEGTNSTASGLSAGTYTVTVSDCSSSATASVNITQPPGMTVSHDSVAATSGCNGIAAVTVVSGGASPYTYSWSFGQTTDTIKSLCANSYCCTITDNNGCSQTTCVTVKSATGIDNISNSSTITIYPNPTTGQFTLSDLQKGMIVEIYDYTGQKISRSTITKETTQLNIFNQANGVYLIRILDKDGNLVTEKKVVKTQ